MSPSALPGAGAAGARAPLPCASLPRRCAALGYETLVVAAVVLVAGFLTAARRAGQGAGFELAAS